VPRVQVRGTAVSSGRFFQPPLHILKEILMSTTYTLIAAVLIMLVMGIILAPIFTNRNRSDKLHDQFGQEYDHAVEVLGDEKKAQLELNQRRKHVEALNIRPLSSHERERYVADWADDQSKFVDEPGQAIVNADRLIMEVMRVRAYPLSDFEQRAADVSVSYPALVGNYRAAKAIALKNENHQATTEELRQAMIHYRSLFDELLAAEEVVA
jgi:hypothetical protein